MNLIFKKSEIYGNINKPKHKTIFIDLDGTCVFHNYDPLKIKDVILPGTVTKLQELREQNFYIVLTTGRSGFQCRHFLRYLKDAVNFEFDRCIFNLPTGKRILINDYKVREESKVAAYEFPRNYGISGLDINEL